MGGSGVLSRGASCSCPASAASRSSLLHTNHQLQSRQPALCFSGLPKKSIWSAGPRPKRALFGSSSRAEGSRGKVASSPSPSGSAESHWPSSNLVLTQKQGASDQEAGNNDLEVPQPEAQGIGAPSFRQEFGGLIASRENSGDLIPKVDGQDLEPSVGNRVSVDKAQTSSGLSSLQSKKRLGAEEGLLGFEKVGEDGARSGVSGAAQSARVSMEATPNNSSVDASGKTEAAEKPGHITKGGTKIIRGKGRGETKRFELFLGQKAPVIELPPSEPIPLSAMGFSAAAASKTEARQQGKRGGALGQRTASASTDHPPKPKKTTIGPAGNKPLEVTAMKTESLPGGPEVHPREELARKVASFASRLFRAVSTSDSHREILPRFLEQMQAKPQNPDPVSEPGQASVDFNATDPLRGSDGKKSEALVMGLPAEVESMIAMVDSANVLMSAPVPGEQTETVVVPSSVEGTAEADRREASVGASHPLRESSGTESPEGSPGVELALAGEGTAETEQPVAGRCLPTEEAPPLIQSAKEPASADEPLEGSIEPIAVALPEPGSPVPTDPPPPMVDEVQPVPHAESFTCPDLEDRILLDEQTAEGGEAAEPLFPHWLASPGDWDTHLADAEATAARIGEGTNAGEETEGGVGRGEQNGPRPSSGKPAAESGAAASQETSAVLVSGGNGAFPTGAGVLIDLRPASGVGIPENLKDSGSLSGEDTLPGRQA